MNKYLGFICPLGSEGSETRSRSDDIQENVIQEIAQELGYTVQRADQMSGSIIMSDIIEIVKNSDILIADLTDNNPNVFYELGLRQAIKGKCINIVSDDWLKRLENEKRGLPFDISHFRAYRYKYTSYKDQKSFREYIKAQILFLEKQPFSPIIDLSNDDIMRYYNATVVTDYRKGQKNHYELAKSLFKEPCKTIFLMQRSSSLVLNAEQDWGTEAVFVRSIKKAMESCEEFYHVISLEGIEAHFNRKNSVFPGFKDFTNNLKNENGIVALKVKNRDDAKFFLRKLQKDEQNSLFKLDRQARVLITETVSGNVNAVIVQNLGDDHTSFQITGPIARKYLSTCIEFYRSCELVNWKEIVQLYEKYQDVESQRGK